MVLFDFLFRGHIKDMIFVAQTRGNPSRMAVGFACYVFELSFSSTTHRDHPSLHDENDCCKYIP